MPPFGGPGLRRAYLHPPGSKRSAYRGAPLGFAPNRQRRFGVTTGLLGLSLKRGASRSFAPCRLSVARGYGGLIFALWTQNAQPTGTLTRPLRRRTPFGFAPNRHRRRGVSTGLFSSSGLKTRGLQELRSLRLRPEPPPAVRGYGRLIFALWAQNARPSGAALPSRACTSPLRIAAESPPAHKRCAGGLGVLGATRGPPCPRRKGAWRAFRPARRRASAGGCR